MQRPRANNRPKAKPKVVLQLAPSSKMSNTKNVMTAVSLQSNRRARRPRARKNPLDTPDVVKSKIDPRESKRELRSGRNVDKTHKLEKASSMTLQQATQNFEAQCRLDQTIDVKCLLWPSRLQQLVDVFINECQKSEPLNGGIDIANFDYGKISATFLADAYLACEGAVTLFDVAPRLWYTIRDALRPCSDGNYTFRAFNPYKGAVNANGQATFGAISGYPDPVYYTNVSNGNFTPGSQWNNAGGVVPVLTPISSVEFTEDVAYTSIFFASYPYILDIVKRPDSVDIVEDPSIFAFRQYDQPPFQNPVTDYQWMQNTFNYREHIPGVWPWRYSGGDTSVGFLRNYGPFLEVPIRNRWLASLGLFTVPTVDDLASNSSPRFARHSIRVQNSSHPKTELFHQFYNRRQLRALCYTEHSYDPVKAKANATAIAVVQGHLRALPVVTFVPCDQYLITAVNTYIRGWDNASGNYAIGAAQAAAVVLIELIRHFQQWCSATALLAFGDLALGGVKSFLQVYGGGTGRLVRVTASVPLPSPVVLNLSMVNPAIVTDSSSQVLVTKMIYPALVLAQTPRDYFNQLSPPFTNGAAAPPWGTWGGFNAYTSWSLDPSTSDELERHIKDTFPREINSLVHHPDVNVLTTVQIRENTSLVLDSRRLMSKHFGSTLVSIGRKEFATFDDVTRDMQQDLSDSLPRSRIGVDAVPATIVHFETAVTKAILDVAMTLITPYFTTGTGDILAIASMLNLPMHTTSVGNLDFDSNKNDDMENTKLLPGGEYTAYGEYFDLLHTAIKELDGAESLFPSLGGSFSHRIPGLLLAGATMLLRSGPKKGFRLP